MGVSVPLHTIGDVLPHLVCTLNPFATITYRTELKKKKKKKVIMAGTLVTKSPLYKQTADLPNLKRKQHVTKPDLALKLNWPTAMPGACVATSDVGLCEDK